MMPFPKSRPDESQAQPADASGVIPTVEIPIPEATPDEEEVTDA